MCLTPEQEQHVYNCIEKDTVITPLEMKTENPKTSVNNFHTITEVREDNSNPFTHWSILSDTIQYATNRNPRGIAVCNIDNADKEGNKENEFDPEQYFNNFSAVDDKWQDKFDAIQNRLTKTTIHDGKEHVATTYLGNAKMLYNQHITKTHQSVKIGAFSKVHFALYMPPPQDTQGNNTPTKAKCENPHIGKALLDTGATQSYMSEEFYKRNPQLWTVPKSKPTTQRLMW